MAGIWGKDAGQPKRPRSFEPVQKRGTSGVFDGPPEKSRRGFPCSGRILRSGEKVHVGGESSGFELMPGLFRENIAVEDIRRFCGAGPGGSGRQKAFAPPGRKKDSFSFIPLRPRSGRDRMKIYLIQVRLLLRNSERVADSARAQSSGASTTVRNTGETHAVV